VKPGVISVPKCTERVSVGIARCGGSRGRIERFAGFVLRDERNVTVGANREALAIFGVASRTNHRRAQ